MSMTIPKKQYAEVLRVCLPLVMSMSATTVMEFTDRVFLANYSIDAISAVAPAGITAILFILFFAGVAGYTQVFIAQYHGAGRHNRIASILWQGIYFSLFAGLLLWLLSHFAAEPIFALAGHPPEIAALEVAYFTIVCRGGLLQVLMTCLSSFFTGRGITRPVMIFHLIGMAVNIPLDYALIYGAWGLPELGIDGAALATVASWLVITLLLASFTFTRNNIGRFSLLPASPFDRALLLRLLKYGVPGSLQFTLDLLAFTIFLLLVGKIGKLELAVTNIVISINAVAFMPSMGVSQGVAILVGQALGRGDAAAARQVTWRAIHLLLAYILVIDLLFILFPGEIMTMFIPPDLAGHESDLMMSMGVALLHIIAAYLFLDALYMTFSGALKGAGDTRFIMWCIGLASLLFMILPVYLGITYFAFTVEQAWYCVLFFIGTLFVIVSLRFRQGKWQKMLVIERQRS